MTNAVVCVTQKKSNKQKAAKGLASEENAATRKEKRRKHGRKQELRKKHNTQKRHSQKNPSSPAHKAQLGGGGRGGGGGSFVFSAQENYFYHLPWRASSKLHLFSVLLITLPSISTSIYPLNQPFFFFYWP
jgi:hypothetical protein